MMSSLTTTAKVGIMTVIGLVILGMITVWKTDLFLVRKGYQLTASFENIEGLTIGSEVRYRGLRVGKVQKVDPGPFDLKLYAVIDPDIKLPADSTLRVAYDGIVGMKFLEIMPGQSTKIYDESMLLYGTRTAAIVDFVDIGSKSLQETKSILETIRKFIDNPQLQRAFSNAIITSEKTANEAERLISELQLATEGLAKITADPKFQENVKGTVQETEKTLASANHFFEGVGKVNMRALGGLDIGTRANAVHGDVDIVQSEKNYYRFGIGEGPTRQLSVHDFLFNTKITDDFGWRLGIINNQLGGGVAFYTSPKTTLRGDIYDINNATTTGTRLAPKVRFGYCYELRDYLDLQLQADDIFNSDNSNVMVGIQVKPLGERIY